MLGSFVRWLNLRPTNTLQSHHVTEKDTMHDSRRSEPKRNSRSAGRYRWESALRVLTVGRDDSRLTRLWVLRHLRKSTSSSHSRLKELADSSPSEFDSFSCLRRETCDSIELLPLVFLSKCVIIGTWIFLSPKEVSFATCVYLRYPRSCRILSTMLSRVRHGSCQHLSSTIVHFRVRFRL